MQATSKKRERQVGEAQGALVIAEAQIGGLEQQIQDLTAANKQASTLRQTSGPHCHNQPLHKVIATESVLPWILTFKWTMISVRMSASKGVHAVSGRR